jgi:phosphoribosylformylglycinamidine synthase subunit PurQ / glutaminase
MKFGVVVFPGSNCDRDTIHVLQNVMGFETKSIFHKETSLEGFGAGDCIVLPGGFSYGDYLRSGAIARFSPIMDAVIKFANEGGYVLGICNGFQVLCEAGLLPGALLRNRNQQFICQNIYMRTETTNSAVTSVLNPGQVLKVPIAHAEGRYYADSDTMAAIVKNDQVLFRYSDKDGNVNDSTNINGATDNIAGITNHTRNVFGMMPHPERASEEQLGNTDGRAIFESLKATVLQMA